MTKTITFGINGVEKAIKKFEKYTDKKINNIKKIVAETAYSIENEAKARTPVDTGNLKNSLHTNIENDGLEAEIGTNVDYSQFVEYGTRCMKAQPFLHPALESHKREFEQKMKKELRDK